MLAVGDPPDFQLGISIAADGTPDFDADNTAGNDSSATNGIVRVNDTVTYQIDYSVNTNPGTNVALDIALPKGVELTSLPGYCLDGSTITPQTAGTPALPLTANSFDELQAQTLHCVIGNKDNSSEIVDLTVKVLNVVQQGQQLQLGSVSIRSDESVDPVIVDPATLPTVTASSRLKWDLSKNGVALTENTGFATVNSSVPCAWDASRMCKPVTYSVAISAPAGGKGAMPAIGDVTFVDDLSPAALYPGLSAEDIARMSADLTKYGSRVVQSVSTNSFLPGSQITATNQADRAVRNSGTTTFTQTSSGTPAQVRISGADWSLRTYPTMNLGNNALPAGVAYAYAHTFVVHTPVDTVWDFGTEAGGVWTLATRNSFTNLQINGMAATDVETSQTQPGPQSTTYPQLHWNDYRTVDLLVGVTGQFQKKFTGVANEPGNMTAAQFSPANGISQGPPGGAIYNSGAITVAETQHVNSLLLIGGYDPDTAREMSTVACDSWDNTSLWLRAAAYGSTPSNAGYATAMAAPNVTPVWVSGTNNAVDPADPTKTVWGTSAADAAPITVQYSASGGAGNGAASLCGDDKGPWFDDPAQVPGNDPAKVAQGVYTGVNRVRVFMVVPQANARSLVALNTVFYFVSIGMQVADNVTSGAIIPNWGGVHKLPGTATRAETLANGTTGTSTYVPATHVGSLGDRLTATDAQTRVLKTVREGTSGEFGSVPPAVSGGSVVQYQLAPSLTSGAQAPGILKDVWVEDCLPGSQIYTGASIAPTVVALTTPADAKRTACAVGTTYLRWVLPAQEVNQPIEPIILTVEVSSAAMSGSYNNTVAVWSDGDSSSEAVRTSSAQIVIDGRAGINLEKRPLTPVVQVNRPGSAQTEVNRWSVRLTSTLPEDQNGTITNPDVIDVLPKNGIRESSFSGTLNFVSANVVLGGPTARILYTNAPTVAQSPNDPTNQPTGSTTWCDAPAGGTVVSGTGACPAAASEVTGLRLQRPGDFASGDIISMELSMVAMGDSAGDVFDNLAYAEIAGLPNPVGPIHRTEVAIDGQIGDRVWQDTNGNGIQDAGEPGVAGVTVTLTGVDDLGNPVNITTTTNADGQYLFDGLRASGPDGYTVTFTPPAGSGFTQQTAGTDTAVDSNAPSGNGPGVVPGIVLTSGEERSDVDAGLVAPGINLVKSASAPANGVGFAVGEKVTYTFTATNTGNLPLSNVTLTDGNFVNGAGATLALDAAPVFDAGASTGTIAAMAPGQTVVWTATYTVTGNDVMAGGVLTNQASVTGTPPPNPDDPTRNFPPPTADDDAEVPVDVANPAIDLVKSATPRAGLVADDTVTYTFTVTNIGNVPLSNLTLSEDSFTNAAGDNLTLTSGPTVQSVTGVADPATWNRALPVGAVAVYTATYVVTAADLAAVGAITNVATATGTPPPGNPNDPNAPPPIPVDDTDDEPVFPRAVPGIEIVKSINGNDANTAPGVQVNTGDTARFTYLVTNVGDTVLTNVKVVDDKGVTVTFPESFTGTLQRGESVTGTGTGPIPAGQYTNIGTVTGTPVMGDGTPVLDENGNPITSVTDDDPANAFGQSPSIDLVKEASPQAGVQVGGTVTYTFTATNTGNVPLSNVTLAEDSFTNAAGDNLKLTSGPTLQSVTGVADPATWNRVLPVGGIAVYTATYVVTAADLATTGPIVNAATVTGTPPPLDPSNPDDPVTPPIPVDDTDDEPVSPRGVPGIEIVKSINGNDANTAPGVQVNAGDAARFTYLVTNVGDTVLTNVKVVDDKGVTVTFPESFTGTLQRGESVTGTGTGPIPAGQYTNIGTVTGTPVMGDGTPVLDENGNPITSVTDDDPANAFGQSPSINLVKAASPRAGLSAGDTVTYTFTATNTGNVPLSNVTLAEDSFTNAAGDRLTLTTGPTLKSVTGVEDVVTWTRVLRPGGIAVWTATYRVTAADLETLGGIDNSATVTGTPPPLDPPNPGDPVPPPTPVDDDDDETVYPVGSPGITIVKSINGNDANTAPGVQVNAGDTAQFTYLVTNVGDTVLTDVKVVDDKGVTVTFPESFTGTLQRGESVTGTGTGPIPAGQYTNIGTVTGTPVDDEGNPIRGTDGEPVGNVTDDDPANAFGQQPSLSVAKTVDKDRAAVGETLTYRVVATNNGNVPLVDVVVSDTLPPGALFESASGSGRHNDGVITWRTSDLSVGESVTFTIRVAVAPGTEATTLVNRVGATGANPNPPGGVPPGENPPSVPGVPTPGTVCADDATQACASTTVTGQPVTVAPTTEGNPGAGYPNNGGQGGGGLNGGSINSGNGTLPSSSNTVMLISGLLLLLMAGGGAFVMVVRRRRSEHQ